MLTNRTSFEPLRRWAPAVWRRLLARGSWRPLLAGPPFAFRTAAFDDPSLHGKPWICSFTYDPREYGDRICVTVAPCDPAKLELKRVLAIVSALWGLRQRKPSVVYRGVRVDSSDCVDGTLPQDVFRFAKKPGEPHPLLPNPYLLRRRRKEATPRPWAAKSSTCWFRGAATGDTAFDSNKRVLLCQIAKNISAADCKITSTPGVSKKFAEQCKGADILSTPTKYAEMNAHRYLIDVDGNTSSWDRYLWTGTFGGVPIRFEPAWIEYWHDRLIDGENVITVSRATLAETLDYLRNDDSRGRAIAERARELVHTTLSHASVLRAFADAWLAALRNTL